MESFGNIVRHALKRPLTAALALGVGVALLAALDATRAEAGDAAANAKKILEFDARNITPSKEYRIAYLTECGQNPYCSARRAGLEAAAQKYGFTYKRFAANFNPATQIKQVQNAITEGFDGYLFAPTAAAPACSMWKRHLEPLDEPTVSLDLPMCDDADYSEGLAATVTMQRQAITTRTSITHWHPARSPARSPRSAVSSAPTCSASGRRPSSKAQKNSRTPRSSWTSRRTSTRAWRSRRSRTPCSRIRTSR